VSTHASNLPPKQTVVYESLAAGNADNPGSELAWMVAALSYSKIAI
jgi:hypothetical protein